MLSSLTFVERAIVHCIYALHICDVSEIHKGDVNGNKKPMCKINCSLKRKNVCRWLQTFFFFFLIFSFIKTLAALETVNGTEKLIRETSPVIARNRANGNRRCTWWASKIKRQLLREKAIRRHQHWLVRQGQFGVIHSLLETLPSLLTRQHGNQTQKAELHNDLQLTCEVKHLAFDLPV